MARSPHPPGPGGPTPRADAGGTPPDTLVTWDEFHRAVAACPRRIRRQAMVEAFLAASRRRGIPLVDGDRAIFLFRGPAETVHLVGDMNGWHRKVSPMERIPGTDLFYLAAPFESDARLDYKFLVDGKHWTLDPENPRHCHGGKGPNSELAMPGYTPPPEVRHHPSIPHGRVETFHLPSRALDVIYPLHVYLPPDYYNSRRHYPVVYLQDGADYLHFGRAVDVLDACIAHGRTVPLIAVFACPSHRAEEYVTTRRDAYRRFFIQRLVPFVDRAYRTQPAPQARLVVGDSYGANIAAVLAWRHPQTFALCGWQSPAFWPNRWETQRMLVEGRPRPLRILSVWGTYELQDASLRRRLDELAAALAAKGCDYQVVTRPAGHSWGLWRDTLPLLLAHFFPPK